MKDILILTLSLAGVCAIASGVLALANERTKDARAQAAIEAKSTALKKVLPEHTNTPLQDTVVVQNKDLDTTFYRARRDNRIVALAGQGATANGYGGLLKVLVGFDPDGTIRKVLVTEHAETPGLGTQATDRRTEKTLGDILGSPETDKHDDKALPPNSYLDQYEQYNLLNKTTYKVKADDGTIDAVSGATISSRAVADAVTHVAKAFETHRQTIVTAPAGETVTTKEKTTANTTF
ncbi:MAG: RnfABCDGE type electron transport complex subunit G [Candidatus Pacebacteria bacterium]|nr:RnfABCDGE type electron transport complex subunit G [Candidatus Paceibacterota bacterium]